MNKLIMVFPLLLIIGILGCGKNSNEKMIVGAWNMSAYISASEMEKMSEEAFPAGIRMEMTMSGSQTYHRGGKYSGNGEITLRIMQGKDEIPLRFLIRDAGTWEVHNDILVETSSDSVVTPLDELTKSVVAQTPELQNMISPVSGEATSIKINHISDSVAELKILGPPNITLTMKKI